MNPNFQPHFPSVETPEPSIYDILMLYYSSHLPHEEAVRYTEDYLQRFKETQETIYNPDLCFVMPIG